ncbi:hypothetical protein [Halosimplex sp. TS25]|uniref:hypothetical protein n=1 Tax=Halosimplex rarum TaxID=3396619 RepID=UPI0039E8AD0E
MRTEREENHHPYRCWLMLQEYKTLKQTAGSYRDSLVIQFGSEVRLRSFEIPQVHPEHIKHVDGHGRLRVPERKDTDGSGEKPRYAYLPEESRANYYGTPTSRTSLAMNR